MNLIGALLAASISIISPQQAVRSRALRAGTDFTFSYAELTGVLNGAKANGFEALKKSGDSVLIELILDPEGRVPEFHLPCGQEEYRAAGWKLLNNLSFSPATLNGFDQWAKMRILIKIQAGGHGIEIFVISDPKKSESTSAGLFIPFD